MPYSAQGHDAVSATVPRLKVLLLIPSVAVAGGREDARRDMRPMPDYFALQDALGADLMDYAALDAERRPALVHLARLAGKDAALAALGYGYREEYDIIFSNGENVGIPLALLLGRNGRRPGHVVIGHRLSSPKKRSFLMRLHSQMDALFVYSDSQYRYAVQRLGVPDAKLHRIPFHADQLFFRPLSPMPEAPTRLISSAGLEWRDYPTLIEAASTLDADVRLAAASPWSRHRAVAWDRPLPPNVTSGRRDYADLRRLYAASRMIVVPLHDTDFQAGITALLEGMAMGKAVVVTRTEGLAGIVRDGENGLSVPPGDPAALRCALLRLLESPEEAERLGSQARRDVEAGYTLDRWVENIAKAMHAVALNR